MLIKHFVLTDDGRIREYSSEEAFGVASGMARIPELARLKVRYLQVRFNEEQEEDALQVITAGATLSFDADGRMCEADDLQMAADSKNTPITAFEQETCVQLALSELQLPSNFQHVH